MTQVGQWKRDCPQSSLAYKSVNHQNCMHHKIDMTWDHLKIVWYAVYRKKDFLTVFLTLHQAHHKMFTTCIYRRNTTQNSVKNQLLKHFCLQIMLNASPGVSQIGIACIHRKNTVGDAVEESETCLSQMSLCMWIILS